jgi:hypothetical protein
MPNFSRRGFAGFLLTPLFRLRSQSAPPAPAECAHVALSRTASRTYRADAVILLLGITVYRRPAVGGGQASLDETGEGASLSRTLFFAAGSDPKHAVGLRRMGWIREAVLGPASGASEAAYFGVMTSSPEESLEGARKTVDTQPSAKCAFSAVSGRNVPGHSRSAVTHFEYAADTLWSDLVATLFKQRARHATGRYVYNEQEYLLDLEMQPADPDGLLPFKGKIRNLRTGKETLFHVWLQNDSASIVPVRIEFQPRSFLRLTFEAVAA